MIKIGTLNLCLGLPNKKELVKNVIFQEEIDILCLQETEIEINIDHNLLSFPGFNYESETNTVRSRVGCYVKSSISYVRRRDLEGFNSHLIILDVIGIRTARIITIYRCFNPQTDISPLNFFKYQIDLIRASYHENTIVLGDFNLDMSKKGQSNYPFKNYFNYMDEKMCDRVFIQQINFPTWTRTVNGIVKQSILDHIYTSDPTSISNINESKPVFGDHHLIVCSVNIHRPKEVTNFKRSWVNYSKDTLCNLLQEENWSIEDDSIQGAWNTFENKLINIVDTLIPYRMFFNNTTSKIQLPLEIKNKMNRRKRLLKSYQVYKNIATKELIRVLDKEIRYYFHVTKSKNVRRSIVPGNTQSLWRAVKIARDVNTNLLPGQMFEKKVQLDGENLPDVFASFFDTKIKNVMETVEIENDVYNGRKMVNSENKMFMGTKSIRSFIITLKPKNSERFD